MIVKKKKNIEVCCWKGVVVQKLIFKFCCLEGVVVQKVIFRFLGAPLFLREVLRKA